MGAALAFGPAAASAQEIVGLITKTNTNPFFVKMKEGAEAKAKELGMELRSYAGKYDGDNEGQVEAVESLIAAGAKGILITPSDSAAIVPTAPAGARCRHPGDRARHAARARGRRGRDLRHRQLQGGRADRPVGRRQARRRGGGCQDRDARPRARPSVSVDVARDQGFLTGFGIDVSDPNRIGDEEDGRIVGHDITQGAEEGGRTAMENLLQRDPGRQRRLHHQRAGGRRRLRGAAARSASTSRR